MRPYTVEPNRPQATGPSSGLAGFFSLPPVLLPRAPGFMAAVISGAFSIGGIFGPWIAGWLVEMTGVWSVPFFTASVCNLAAATLLTLGVAPQAIGDLPSRSAA